ncbi:MAG: sulfurtransferase TusA family protein [Magnetospirillum sp.]|nr:MAG: sulfurtransferase TusA family protein [Magnetospirillum sp.]
MSKTVLDVKGLNCPLPILRAKKAIKDLSTGAVLEVIATDPGSVKDFDAFCRQTGNELVSQKEAGGVYTFEIKKGA